MTKLSGYLKSMIAAGKSLESVKSKASKRRRTLLQIFLPLKNRTDQGELDC